MITPLLLRRARRPGQTETVDLYVADGRVRTAAEHDRGETVDLNGRFVMPGLWDAHVHFDQWAATRQRLDLSTARSAAATAELVRVALVVRDEQNLLLGYGFRDGLWADVPTRELLDAAAPATPTVLVSGDLHAAWLNSAAIGRFGLAACPDALLREGDWLPIMNDVLRVPESVGDEWAADAVRAAATRGVVGVVDFELPDALPAWKRRFQAGFPELRVVASVWPQRWDDALARGFRSGDVVPGTRGLVTMGPLKVITDGSLNTRTAFCHQAYPGTDDDHGVLSVPAGDLVNLLRRARSAGVNAAVHAIGDWANQFALDAFAASGASGSIEHAQLMAPGDFARLAELGLVASVQPEHLLDDRDVADRHWAGRTDRAFAYGSLVAAGARLALGSDAPVAPLDPWLAISAAVTRTKAGRSAWHPEQRIPVGTALAASTRGRVTVDDGGPADLVVLDTDPLTTDPAALREMPVAGTMVAGRWSHRTF